MSRDQLAERKYRLGMANLILNTFVPGVVFYEGLNGLRMRWGNKPQDFPATLTSQGNWFRYGYNRRPTGGTGLQAMAQLARYVRDLPRLPERTWEYWASPTVGLGSTNTLALIHQSTYGDPRKTCCVLCGQHLWNCGIDWWSLDGITGPSCLYAKCIPEWMNASDQNFAKWIKSYRLAKKGGAK